MLRPKTFFYSLSKSATEPQYYIDVLRSPIRFSVQFFLGSVFLASILGVINWRVFTFPKIYQAFDEQAQQIVKSLPPTFKATYQNGAVQFDGIGLPQEYIATDKLQNLGFGPSLLTLESSDDSTNSSFTIGKSQLLVAAQPEIGIPAQAFPYKEFGGGDGSLTQGDLQYFTDQAAPYAYQLATLVAIPGTIINWIFLLITYGLLLIVFSFLSQTAAWIIGIRMRYIKVLQLGLHAMGVAAIFEELKNILTHSQGFTILSLAYAGIMIIVLWSLRAKSSLAK